MDIVDFLRARLDEDEAAARAVPPLGHNFDMGGNRQDERFTFGRTLPSSADGMGNWSSHRTSPATAAHFSRHNPARVLAEVESKRRIVWCAAEQPEVMGEVVAHLAEVYAGHPDYDESWRP